ncbi:MAG: hypothetical protein P8J59_03690 [Phycisphaerales bacterium]|nr:hypothetical protein [Phycisphaerales bacterium]
MNFAAGFLILIVGACGVALVFLGLGLWMIYLVYRAAASIPAEHRRMEPGLVWLLVIPLFQIFWAFFVASQVPGGFVDAFEERGLDRGDCGRFKGMAFAICSVAQMVVSIVGSGLQFAGAVAMDSMARGAPPPAMSPMLVAGLAVQVLGYVVGLVGLVFVILFVVEVNRRGKELKSLGPSVVIGDHPRTA